MTGSNSYSGIVEGLDGSIRLDRYAAETLALLSRSQIKARTLEAKVNGRNVKISRPVKNGDLLELSWNKTAPLFLEPENINLDVIYEDDRCIVINKKQGMVIHPGAGNHGGTLANALYWRLLHKKPGPVISGTESGYSEGAALTEEMPGFRNGIVHRLDKDTSGAVIAAYDDDALAFLSAQFKARTVRKRYIALVQGIPASEGRIITRMTRDTRDRKRFTAIPYESAGPGKIAVTRYRTLKSWPGYSLMLLEPKTGRTHQLRVHLKYLGYPIIGDPVYNPLSEDRRRSIGSDVSLMLHALSLGIVIPGEKEMRFFKAPVPDRFKTIIKKLNRP